MPTATKTRGRLAQPVPDGRERRRRGQGAPVHHPELAHLSLADLRSYRQELIDEETRVSYWRRLVQAQLDGGEADGWELQDDLLVRLHAVLADEATSGRRVALLAVGSAAEAPSRNAEAAAVLAELAELPALTALVEQSPVRDRLENAVAQLTDLRQLLRERLDAATEDLVSRYSQSPLDCLVALPVDPRQRQSA
ncbi:MAG: RsiG family protein [Actinomycetales bacterium]